MDFGWPNANWSENGQLLFLALLCEHSLLLLFNCLYNVAIWFSNCEILIFLPSILHGSNVTNTSSFCSLKHVDVLMIVKKFAEPCTQINLNTLLHTYCMVTVCTVIYIITINRVQNKHSNLVGHLQKMSPYI